MASQLENKAAGTHVYHLSYIGDATADVLKNAGCGQIMAVFDRCFYARTPAGLFCAGVAQLGRGPLNALLHEGPIRLPFAVRTGDSLRLADNRIVLAGGVVLDAASAANARNDAVELASLPPDLPSLQTLKRNRVLLVTLNKAPVVGFACLLKQGMTGISDQAGSNRLQAALIAGTASALSTLRSWLHRGLHPRLYFGPGMDPCGDAPDAGNMLELLGAGPGLTPAGDDLLAGVMLALYRLNHSDLAQTLWHGLTPALASRTHAISAAHLQQAARGVCSDATAQLLDQVLGSEVFCPSDLQADLTSSGSGSAWDTLAGMTLVVDAWLDNAPDCESYTGSVTGLTTG